MSVPTFRTLMNLLEARIEGLPDDLVVKDRSVDDKLSSGRYRLTAKPSHGDNYEVEVHPHDGEHTYKPYHARDSVSYHDPELADVHDKDEPEEILRGQRVRPKAGLMTDIPPLDVDAIYRGMSYEEFQNFLETGEIASKGDYNIGDAQNGLTYWTTEVRSAETYANGFAPERFKPTFSKPCYVVAARVPSPADIRHVKGVAAHEVGVTRPISSDEVLAAWEGRVYDFRPGSFSLRPDGYGEKPDYKMGGGSAASASVVWKRII